MFKYGKDHLTVSKAIAIAKGELKAIIDIETKGKIQTSHEAVLTIANGDTAVYGINTGFGPLCNTIIPKDKTTELQRKLLLSHSVGVGKPVSKILSKLMLILKIHALSKGFSGISLIVLERIMWHIDHDIGFPFRSNHELNFLKIPC